MPRRNSPHRNSQPSAATPAMPALRFTEFDATFINHYPALSIIGNGPADPLDCQAEKVVLAAWHVRCTCVVNDQECTFEGAPVFRDSLDGSPARLFLRSNWLQPVEVDGTFTSLSGCPLPSGWFRNAGLSPEEEAVYRASFAAAATRPAIDMSLFGFVTRAGLVRGIPRDMFVQELADRLRGLQAETQVD